MCIGVQIMQEDRIVSVTIGKFVSGLRWCNIHLTEFDCRWDCADLLHRETRDAEPVPGGSSSKRMTFDSRLLMAPSR